MGVAFRFILFIRGKMMLQSSLDRYTRCKKCGIRIKIKNSMLIGDKHYCMQCAYELECKHDSQHKREIPDLANEEYWVCDDCGETLDKTDTSVY